MADYNHRKLFRKALKNLLEQSYTRVIDFKDSKIEPEVGEISVVFYIDTGQFEDGHNVSEDQFVLVVELWTDSRENLADDLDDAAAALLRLCRENDSIAECDWYPTGYEYVYDPDSFIGFYEQRFIVQKEL